MERIIFKKFEAKTFEESIEEAATLVVRSGCPDDIKEFYLNADRKQLRNGWQKIMQDLKVFFFGLHILHFISSHFHQLKQKGTE